MARSLILCGPNNAMDHKSADERSAEELFRELARAVYHGLGRDTTRGDQLDDAGSRLFGRKWAGVWHMGNFDPSRLRDRYAVVNTSRTDSSPGYHWVASYTSPRGATTIWDSFGRNVRTLAWPLFHRALREGLIVRGGDRDAQQRGASRVCGQMSLAWLLTVREIGVRRARLV
jgi:hypothetical protein